MQVTLLKAGMPDPTIIPAIAAGGGIIKTGNSKFPWGFIIGLASGALLVYLIYHFGKKDDQYSPVKMKDTEKKPESE